MSAELRTELIGHNVPKANLDKLLAGEDVDPRSLSPQILSAAGARISRDPRDVPELIEIAADPEELEKTGGTNYSVVFGLGHHSVAEHAILNFGVMNMSRLAIEFPEYARLVSFTEKSQRYIDMRTALEAGEFTYPSTMPNSLRAEAEALVEESAVIYTDAVDRLKAYHIEQFKDTNGGTEPKKAQMRGIQGKAQEDARYATLLGLQGQFEMTINARNLELMIRLAENHPLPEVRNFGQQLQDEAVLVVPDLIVLSDSERFKEVYGAEVSNSFMANYRGTLSGLAEKAFVDAELITPFQYDSKENVTFVDATPNADTKIITALLHSASPDRRYAECYTVADNMRAADARNGTKLQEEFLLSVFADKTLHDPALRELEHADITFEAIMSASAYAQMKRHRMCTQTVQDYNPELGHTMPPNVIAAGLDGKFKAFFDNVDNFYTKLAEENPAEAPYMLSQAHRRRVLTTMNLREVHAFNALRLDQHAQWDIRQNIAEPMFDLAKPVAPASLSLAVGKHVYDAEKDKLYGAK